MLLPGLQCKMAKDEEMFAETENRDMRPNLAYMGATKFCLVERVAGANKNVPRDACVIRLNVFGLKYSYKGELQIADHHRSTRSFLASGHHYRFALWV